MTKEIQEVEVWVSISGNYCAFHEMGFSVMYDITNDVQLRYDTLEEIEEAVENEECGEYFDYEVRKAIKVGDTYYVEW